MYVFVCVCAKYQATAATFWSFVSDQKAFDTLFMFFQAQADANTYMRQL